ncbi:hypothetical protein VVD49_11810 [Uliginosibacterium sp. H3]|uniref:Uncharacterized protein n=1 Tax=Uliginosibacterium silvisoli TaxID=3114758 RepID=A0ABU6K433_9RHOO|nr:hypothetical protein [Uliginosibacterium sp. H3]
MSKVHEYFAGLRKQIEAVPELAPYAVDIMAFQAISLLETIASETGGTLQSGETERLYWFALRDKDAYAFAFKHPLSQDEALQAIQAVVPVSGQAVGEVSPPDDSPV